MDLSPFFIFLIPIGFIVAFLFLGCFAMARLLHWTGKRILRLLNWKLDDSV